MKSQGEIEAAVCDGLRKFQLEYMGRGPEKVHAYLVGDLLLVRMTGVLTAAEKQLVNSSAVEKGVELVKQIRILLLEAARSRIEAMVREETGVDVVSLHHDISTRTGEEIIVFTLVAAPCFRETKNGRDKSSRSYGLVPFANHSRTKEAVV